MSKNAALVADVDALRLRELEDVKYGALVALRAEFGWLARSVGALSYIAKPFACLAKQVCACMCVYMHACMCVWGVGWGGGLCALMPLCPGMLWAPVGALSYISKPNPCLAK